MLEFLEFDTPVEGKTALHLAAEQGISEFGIENWIFR